jgi:hypothetical protein
MIIFWLFVKLTYELAPSVCINIDAPNTMKSISRNMKLVDSESEYDEEQFGFVDEEIVNVKYSNKRVQPTDEHMDTVYTFKPYNEQKHNVTTSYSAFTGKAVSK